MTVPEQRHFFFQRSLREQHAIGPPISDALRFKLAGTQPVEKPIRHLLHTAITRWFDLDPQGLALVTRHIRGRWARHRKGIETGIKTVRGIEGRQGLLDVLIAHQVTDCLRCNI